MCVQVWIFLGTIAVATFFHENPNKLLVELLIESIQIYKLLNQIHRRTETLVNETANYNQRIDYLWGVMKNGCEKEDRKRGG